MILIISLSFLQKYISDCETRNKLSATQLVDYADSYEIHRHHYEIHKNYSKDMVLIRYKNQKRLTHISERTDREHGMA